MLKQFIEKLSNDLGFEQALDANADGSYALRFEPDIKVILKENSREDILLYELAELPTHNVEAFLLTTMNANLFGKETGMAGLGLNSSGKKVVLSTFLLEEKDYPAFHDGLEEFINYAAAWRQEVVGFGVQQKNVEG